ncbi:hypothetical protein HZS_7419 [Henneguya salminicola]|nr:hypothetical protein HZS_7419 [Henneguya salminicola]
MRHRHCWVKTVLLSSTCLPYVYDVHPCKKEEMYCTVLREIVVLTKYHWMPVSTAVLFPFKTSPFQKIKKIIPDIYLVLKLIEILTSNSVTSYPVSAFLELFFENMAHKLWNINKTDEKNMAGRANNALKWYNRRFGK